MVFRTHPIEGLSQKTIEEEDIPSIQIGGLYPVNRTEVNKPEKQIRYYSAFLFTSYILAYFGEFGMVMGSYYQGETTHALEASHMFLILINMSVQVFVHHYYSDITARLYRAINDKFFSYGDTMNDDCKERIKEMAEKKNRRKMVQGNMFKAICIASGVGALIKKPCLYVINGHGVKDVDGLDWVIFESPTGLYIPYSDHWAPYVLGYLFSVSLVFIVATAVSASVSTFIRFSEEFLHQLFIVKLGLRNVNARAQHLYNMKFGTLKPKDNTMFERCLRECLNKSVEHHHKIVDLFKDYKRLMYYPLFTVIFDGSALICMSTVIMMTNESLAVRMSIPSFMIGEIYYTYVYCGYGEQLTQAFAEIGEQLYFDDFLEHSKLMKPYMIAMNAFTLVPQELSAAGFTSPNLQSFGNVMRTAYSLLNFLITLK